MARGISRFRHSLLPAAAYGIAIAAFFRLGFDTFRIEWLYYWQLLDQVALAEEPLKSLYLLHAQPPLLNTILAVVLALSRLTGVAPEVWAWGLFALLGLVSTLLLYRMLLQAGGSWALALTGVILILANPAYHVFQTLFFYPFLLHGMLVVGLYFSLRMLRTGRAWLLAAVAVTLGLVSNTWSLFHPVWAVLACLLLVALFHLGHRGQGKLRWTHVGVSAAILGLLLVAWPLKNQVVFGQFIFSSWEGYNLSRGTEVRSDELEAYAVLGVVPESTLDRMAEFQSRHALAQIDVLSQTLTTAGGRNWNHYLLLEVNGPLKRASIRYRLDHPVRWLRLVGRNYAAWTQGSYIQPYLGTIMGPEGTAYQRYAGLYDTLLFLDLRPWLERHAPRLFQDLEVQGRPLPLTIFGLVTLPGLAIAAMLAAVRRWRRKEHLPAAEILIPAFTVLWLIAIPCLTDGSEGNRMRFAVTSYLVVLAVAAARELLQPSKQ